MEKIEKAILKKTPTITELARIVSDIVIEHYGQHNYEAFKGYINERLNK